MVKEILLKRPRGWQNNRIDSIQGGLPKRKFCAIIDGGLPINTKNAKK